MNNKYLIVDSFVIKGVQVLTLDKERAFDDFNTNYILIDGKKYEYRLTHNERWIIAVDLIENVEGKEASFTT